ncbi:MAG: tRNA (N6-isopentenyl adenosine(37)-C2)-methylthiotransferase MiaB [Butyrivibrio sp.]|nr:tRNA (N6-isopentenyl adenosine(37)-C2)-methylthiotransferase MiaB [Butyrivibrio sp.]
MNGNILNSNINDIKDEESSRALKYIELAKEKVTALEKELGRKMRACVVTFGCQMNARDSEKLLATLSLAGYEETDSEDADFVIYNTCTVRDNADQRVYGRLGQLGNLKKNNPHMKVAICGCMMQETSSVEKIQKSYRFVDLIFGTHNIYKFAELLNTTLESDRMIIDIWKDTDKIVEDLPVKRKYSFKSGVNIMYGCNNFCTYCIVPYVRGRERSRSPREIIRECEKLSGDGVKEVMLLGQNVNSYGLDFADNDPDRISFALLLEEVCKVDGIKRVRFMTPHPKDFSDELLDVIERNPKIARHIHLPLQAGNNEILRRMNRKYTKEQYLALVDKIRKKLPDVAITTDIIVGFPGETSEMLDDTIDVVRKASFDNAFTFIYSKRTGTPAAGFEDQVPEDVVKENFDRLLKVVQDTAKEQALKLSGRVEEVLVEGRNDHDERLLTGRMSNNTLVHFEADESLIGSFVNVRLDECHGFYYMGRMV